MSDKASLSATNRSKIEDERVRTNLVSQQDSEFQFDYYNDRDRDKCPSESNIQTCSALHEARSEKISNFDSTIRSYSMSTDLIRRKNDSEFFDEKNDLDDVLRSCVNLIGLQNMWENDDTLGEFDDQLIYFKEESLDTNTNPTQAIMYPRNSELGIMYCCLENPEDIFENKSLFPKKPLPENAQQASASVSDIDQSGQPHQSDRIQHSVQSQATNMTIYFSENQEQVLPEVDDEIRPGGGTNSQMKNEQAGLSNEANSFVVKSESSTSSSSSERSPRQEVERQRISSDSINKSKGDCCSGSCVKCHNKLFTDKVSLFSRVSETLTNLPSIDKSVTHRYKATISKIFDSNLGEERLQQLQPVAAGEDKRQRSIDSQQQQQQLLKQSSSTINYRSANGPLMMNLDNFNYQTPQEAESWDIVNHNPNMMHIDGLMNNHPECSTIKTFDDNSMAHHSQSYYDSNIKSISSNNSPNSTYSNNYSIHPPQTVQKASKKLTNYFWIVNSHNNNNSKNKFGKTGRNSAKSNSQCDLTRPSDKLEEKIRQDEVEQKLLLKDIMQRDPDPIKLLSLGQKMEEVGEKIENLDKDVPDELVNKDYVKKEKNKLASRCCRLKKKALFEANLMIFKGLKLEKNALTEMNEKINNTIKKHLEAIKSNKIRPDSAQKLSPQLQNIIDSFKHLYDPVHQRSNDFVQDLLNRTNGKLYCQNQQDIMRE